VYCVHDNSAGFNIKFEQKLFGNIERLHTQTGFRGGAAFFFTLRAR
jgi:hypothetical protein